MTEFPPPKHLIKFYFELQDKLEENWGDNSIVLLQNGKFYEMYQVHEHGKAKQVSKILSMRLNLKNGCSKPHSIDNPYMAGLPKDKLSNHLYKILRENFIVEVYDQITLTGCVKKGYIYNKTYSPTIFVDEGISNSNWTLAVDLYSWKCPITGVELYGLFTVLLDFTTGESYYLEVLDTPKSKIAITELNRIVNSYKPKLIVSTQPIPNIKTIIVEEKSEYKKPSYQNNLLSKCFDTPDLKTTLEYLNLNDKPEISYNYLLLINYAYRFDKDIIKKLKYPKDISIQKCLHLNRDSVDQLHISQLFDFLNKTQTPMGERLLKWRLYNPLLKKNKLNIIYDQIENISENDLSGIIDLEKISRKMLSLSVKPYDIPSLHDSLIKSRKILKDNKDLFGVENTLLKSCKRFYTEIDDTFDLNILRKRSEDNFFRDDEKLNSIENQILELKRFFYKVAEKFSEKVTVENNERDGYYLKTTKTRSKKITEFNEIVDSISLTIDDFDFENTASYTKISCKYFKKINDSIDKLQSELKDETKKIFLDKLERYIKNYYDDLIDISKFIAEIDFVDNISKISKKRGYTRPVFDYDSFKAVKLRHPIIEDKLDTEYIPNDIDLTKGKLIYGINTVGKSSLLRSIGLAVIMAQAGIFVACEKLHLKIYNNIISKISVYDDINQGKSSYMMELEEISDMVSLADSKTLVISDELCCSTEVDSAVALVASVIDKLVERKATFVFSTHLRDLQFECCDSLEILHMKAEINGSKLTSDRKLHPGGIVDNYGLELARAWGLDEKLLEKAFKIRDGEEIIKTSNYNKGVYMESCKICGSKKDLHTHHIVEQAKADKYGLIDGRYHKNKKFNLLVVCESCHRKIHS